MKQKKNNKILLEHIQELKYEDKPDYDMLNDVFTSAMQRESVKESDLFDWEKEASEEESNAAANHTLKTTLQLAGITGITTRADLLQSQKNGLGATLGNPSLAMTPYGDHNPNNHQHNQKEPLVNDNNNNNSNNNNNIDLSYNYEGAANPNNTNNNNLAENNTTKSAAGANVKKIPKSLDRNAMRSKRNVASIIPSMSNLDLQPHPNEQLRLG